MRLQPCREVKDEDEEEAELRPTAAGSLNGPFPLFAAACLCVRSAGTPVAALIHISSV